jgi:hypothetical protein
VGAAPPPGGLLAVAAHAAVAQVTCCGTHAGAGHRGRVGVWEYGLVLLLAQ